MSKKKNWSMTDFEQPQGKNVLKKKKQKKALTKVTRDARIIVYMTPAEKQFVNNKALDIDTSETKLIHKHLTKTGFFKKSNRISEG